MEVRIRRLTRVHRPVRDARAQMLAIVAMTRYSGCAGSGTVDGVFDSLAETVAREHIVSVAKGIQCGLGYK